MLSLYQRIRRLLRANSAVPHGDMLSISNVVIMREKLEQRYQQLIKERARSMRLVEDYSALIELWGIRQHQAESFKSSQESVLTEMGNLAKIAQAHKEMYAKALSAEKDKTLRQTENEQKMNKALYGLKAFERKFSLDNHLASTSSVLLDKDKDSDIADTREISRLVHTARALIELKEEPKVLPGP